MKKLLFLLSLLIAAPSMAHAQPLDPSLNRYLPKNRGRATGPIRLRNYVAGSEPAVNGGGWLIYDSTNAVVSFWNGAAWTDITAGGGGGSFDAITTGTNLIATMTCGTGCAIGPAGTGTVAATTLTSTELNTIALAVDAVGLTIEASGAQTAHLQDWDLNGGTTAAYVLSQGSAHFPQVNAGDTNEFGATIAGATIPGYLSVGDDTTTPQLDLMIQRHTGAVAATSPLIEMLKSRGTAALPTVIVTGDQLGQIDAGGYDGTDYVSSGAILFEATGTVGNDRVPSQMRFLTSTDAAPSVPTVAMTIDEAQVVTFANTPVGALPVGVNNNVLTSDGASGAVSEANMTFTGSALAVTGTISARPAGTGAGSEAFGAGSTATGASSTAMGLGAHADASGCTVFGKGASASTDVQSIAIGDVAHAEGQLSLAIGRAASADVNNANAIGWNTAVTGANGIALGTNTKAGASQFTVGSDTAPITATYIGEGVTSGTPQALTLNATGGSGSDIAVGSFTIAGAKSTGSGAGGDLIFQVHNGADTAASTLNGLATVMTMVAGVVRYPKVETQIVFAEVTEPADVGSYGQLYTTTSNDLRFKDGAGVDHQVTLHDAASMYFNANGTAAQIETANSDHSLIEYTSGTQDGNWTFDAGQTSGTANAISAFADAGAGQMTVTDTGFGALGIAAGDVVSIHGTTNYNGVFVVANVQANSFEITHADNGDDATGDWTQGSSLIAGAGDEGDYTVDFKISALPAAGTPVCIWTTYVNATAKNETRISRKFANATDVGAIPGGGIIGAVVAGDIITMAVQCDGTNNMTNSYGAVVINRH